MQKLSFTSALKFSLSQMPSFYVMKDIFPPYKNKHLNQKL